MDLNLHFIQMAILNQLLHNPKQKFSDFKFGNISSDHLNYHLKTLIKLQLINKDNNLYCLTIKGKEFANRMDTDNLKIEKQPKVGVMVVVERKRDGKRELLIQTRTKEPYYGFNGFITGKVKFGEKVEETARRELLEETGLQADFELKYIIHEHVKDKEKKLLEDKIFHVFLAINPRGNLISTRDGQNNWLDEKSFRKIKKVYSDEIDILDWIDKPESFFMEKDYIIDSF